MKIVSLGVENVKRVVALEIQPNGNLVQITGKNGNGKTSVLDSIWWALAGKKPIQSKPIRDGEKEATIVLVLGDPKSEDPKKRRELVITRKFRLEDDGDYTTGLKVRNAEGWAPEGGGQELLNTMIGVLSFDPLTFASMDAADQYEVMKGFVPDFDFVANAGERQATYERRTDANKYKSQAEAAAAMIAVPKDTPEEESNVSDLVDELQAANEHNNAIERRKENRQRHADKIASMHVEASRLQKQADELRKQADDALARSKVVTAEAEEMGEELRKAETLPDEKNVTEIRAKIEKARQDNQAVANLKQRRVYEATAKKYSAESESLTARIDELDKEKAEAIAKAQMPVEGLSLGDGIPVFNGVPFDQASDAERLRVSVAIAASMNPELRVIRVRRGSDLDSNGMRLLAELADKHDFQIWTERVDESGEVGFVIEDGRLKGQVLPEKKPEQPPPPVDEFSLSGAAPAARTKRTRKAWQGPGAPKDAAP